MNGPAGGNNYTAVFVVGGGAARIVSNSLTVTDPDSPALKSAEITLLNDQDGSSELLAANVSGTNIQIVGNTGHKITLQGDDNAANYQKVLRTTTYQNTSGSPTLTERRVRFEVSDGEDTSNRPRSTVRIIDPQISISKQPETQEIAKGGTAEFEIEVTNTGNIALESVIVIDALAPLCSSNVGMLGAGSSEVINCTVNNVQDDFINEAIVTAEDEFGNEVSAADSARVEVRNPNIQIVKSPNEQVVRPGETATFNIFVINTSKVVDLKNVMVADALAPNCDRSIGDLAAEEQVIYSCQKTAVTAAFVNTIMVTGQNVSDDTQVQDSSLAAVELLDMHTALTAEPFFLTEDGGLVQFEPRIENTGSVPITLQSLSIDKLGSLLNAGNAQLVENTCADAANSAIDPGEALTCTVSAEINGDLGEMLFELSAGAEDDDGNDVSHQSTTTVYLVDASLLEVMVDAAPASIPAPGGRVKETISVKNLSTGAQAATTLHTLHHSLLGNIAQLGNCELPLVLEAGQSYTCAVDINISGAAGEVITDVVTAVGTRSDGIPAGGSDQVQIRIFSEANQQSWLPVTGKSEENPEEDNDERCDAFMLFTGFVYRFMMDDSDDWYYFNNKVPGEVTVRITNLLSTDAQVQIYQSSSCADELGPFVTFNGDLLPDKTLTFDAEEGRYYIWIANPSAKSLGSEYTVEVQAP